MIPLNKTAGDILAALIISIVITGAAYAAIFAVFYFTADEVNCGNIGPIPYCSGTYEITSNADIQQNVSVDRTCYRNGEKINCSKLQADFYEVQSK